MQILHCRVGQKFRHRFGIPNRCNSRCEQYLLWANCQAQLSSQCLKRERTSLTILEILQWTIALDDSAILSERGSLTWGRVTCQAAANVQNVHFTLYNHNKITSQSNQITFAGWSVSKTDLWPYKLKLFNHCGNTIFVTDRQCRFDK